MLSDPELRSSRQLANTATAPGAGTSTTSALSPRPPSPTTTVADAGTATDQYAPVISKDDSGSDSGGSEVSSFDLERELAELKALRGRLASLAKEVDARALRLAAGVRSTAGGGSALVDCDGPRCVLRAVRRKAGYAVQALRVGGGGGSGGGEEEQNRHRRRQRRDGTESEPDLEHQGGVVEGFDLLVHRLLFSIVAVFTVQHMAIGVGLMLLCFAVLWCGSLCRDVLRKAACGWLWRWRAQEGRIRLESEAVPVDWSLAEKEEEYLDEKRGGPGEEERYGNEKARFDEERYRDEYAPLVDEDVEVVEDSEEYEANEERLALGDELASFRSAVELVESMVAAADERNRGRTSHRAA